MPAPETVARQRIDDLLVRAGWILQDFVQFNRNAAVGVAVREFPLPGGPPDYLLFVDGKAAGVIEAKKSGVTLSGVAEQSEDYLAALPTHIPKWADPLPLAYESTGDETYFRDSRDPAPRSRPVFAFHRPETLRGWLAAPDTLRGRLHHLPQLTPEDLRGCQFDAIGGLERSLAGDHPRALIQMATGSGKTYTACNFIYRLLKFAGARRVLFLVDRNNLGDQTLREFQAYHPRDDGRSFATLYNVQHLKSNTIDKDAKVVITTIQRLYSMLRGETEFDEAAEEVSNFETLDAPDAPERTVEYSPGLPIETFDFVVTDECHRSIYKVWRQALEYFDAYIIGLTATPSAQTLGFFRNNLVMEYPYERSVVDGVNVGYEIYRLKTRVSEKGSTVAAKFAVGMRDRRTRRVRWQELDQALTYTPSELDRSVTAPDQIRTILKAYKARLFTELFPGREHVPKTLIFAKDDNHAEEIVHIAREVFEQGNDFCKKITYRVTGESPKDLISRFRNEMNPRIAVTVDMVATGTDVKPIEVVMFMRDVKSSIYYEQMKGRGARTIQPGDLQRVTPDAAAKTKFVLIDAVGVTESLKSDSQPLERRKSVGFDKLLDLVAQGKDDDDTLSSLAGRLAALEQAIAPEERERIAQTAGGRGLSELSGALLDAVDPDRIAVEAATRFGPSAGEGGRAKATRALKDAACRPFDNPTLRQLLKEAKRRTEIVIDEVTQDEVTYAGFDIERAKAIVARFAEFIAANRDRLVALEIIYGRRYGERKLTYAAIRELAEALERPPWLLSTAAVWMAYQRLEQARVRGVTDPGRLLTNIVALVRFGSGQDERLEPFDARVDQLFNLWLGRHQKAGRSFTPEQLDWLRKIKDHVAANIEMTKNDFQDIPAFADKGGLVRARNDFGKDLDGIIDDLNKALVA